MPFDWCGTAWFVSSERGSTELFAADMFATCSTLTFEDDGRSMTWSCFLSKGNIREWEVNKDCNNWLLTRNPGQPGSKSVAYHVFPAAHHPQSPHS